MEPAFEIGNVYVLLSKPDPDIIPVKPEAHLGVQLAGQVELTGFSLREEALYAGEPAQLALFWKALQPLDNYKVFVHLRNQNNQTVAQADHIPSEALIALPTNTWHVGEVVPDVTFLTVPPDLPSGDYHLLVGMYNPGTLERLPVEGDVTGENAAVIATLHRP